MFSPASTKDAESAHPYVREPDSFEDVGVERKVEAYSEPNAAKYTQRIVEKGLSRFERRANERLLEKVNQTLSAMPWRSHRRGGERRTLSV